MAERSVIRQNVVFSARAAELFDAYLDPVAHAAITGSPVRIGRRPGDAFEAFQGVLKGSMLAIVEPNLIVQSWRSAAFHEDDPDSILVLSFSEEPRERGRIDLVHVDVPEHDRQGVTDGWEHYYWTPWRAVLENRS